MQAKHFVLRVCLCFILFTQSPVISHDPDETPYETSKIVPDVLDKPPKSVLDVKYDFIPVKVGQEMEPADMLNEPEVNWDADPDKFYTLLVSCPDSPMPRKPIFREARLWLVGNIPGKNISAGEVLSSYSPPSPSEGTALHRYVFLLFEQPKNLVFDETKALTQFAEARAKTSTRKFAKKYQLGEPIASTFFEAQWDESVPRLYEQLAELKAFGFDFSRFL